MKDTVKDSNKTIRTILEDLARVQENMLSLSDDIWLNIDHNDSEELQRGYEFKKAYNEKMTAFDRLATDISVLVQQYTAIRLDSFDDDDGTGKENADEKNARIIRDLNRDEAHAITEQFTFKRPCGFVLCGKGYSGINTWRGIFEKVCQLLHERNAELFKRLPTHEDFLTRRGNPLFSINIDALRHAAEVVPGLYAEVNLSANALCEQMRLLLHTFGISENDMTVYLRQDRDVRQA
ncbi:MAG: hypothetical protein EOL87_07600 [Spartobacteria bacterium]|nr:hypothetical protein [Spartobacteria bacterium]